MADAFKFQFKGRKLQSRLKKKARRLSDLTQPLKKSLTFMTRSIISGTRGKQVETLDVGQQKFKKLSPAYKARKKREFPRARILVATGLMLQPVWFLKRIGKRSATLRYDASEKVMARALTHQKPITSKLPRRKWFGFRRGDQEKIFQFINKHVSKVLAK